MNFGSHTLTGGSCLILCFGDQHDSEGRRRSGSDGSVYGISRKKPLGTLIDGALEVTGQRVFVLLETLCSLFFLIRLF